MCNNPNRHSIDDLIQLFDQCFYKSFNTRLIRGENEPIYLPANAQTPYHSVIFAHGYYASALHEIAHWCLAGEKRRLLEDYGYWYAADGRNKAEQQAFEQVECKPQAIEWLLSSAADFKFRVSCDNLNGSFEPDRHAFRRAVYQQVLSYLNSGIPSRAKQLITQLSHFYQVNNPYEISRFKVTE